eukprot:m.228838 g.228838  ORF g.228838 m.228838 type:complete len:1124 (+) comp10856_c0_seq29:1917-5288(+)
MLSSPPGEGDRGRRSKPGGSAGPMASAAFASSSSVAAARAACRCGGSSGPMPAIFAWRKCAAHPCALGTPPDTEGARKAAEYSAPRAWIAAQMQRGLAGRASAAALSYFSGSKGAFSALLLRPDNCLSQVRRSVAAAHRSWVEITGPTDTTCCTMPRHASTAAAGTLLALAVLVTVHGPSTMVRALPRRALGQHIEHHELVQLDTAALHRQIHQARRRRAVEGTDPIVRIDVLAFGTPLNMRLRNTEAQFARNFQARAIGPNGAEPIHLDMSVFFRGHVDNAPRGRRSYVRATIVNGTVDASIDLGDESYFIEPASRYYPAGTDINGDSHVVYRLSDYNHQNATGAAGASTMGAEGSTCGHAHWSQPEDSMYGRHDQNQRFRRAAQPYDPNFRTCELHLIADHRFFASTSYGGSSTTATANLLIGYLEDANRIFKFTSFINPGIGDDYIGINFAIRYITVWTAANAVENGVTNPFAQATSDYSVFLGQVGNMDLSDVCLGHAFTHQDFNDGVLGLAWKPTYSLGGSNTGICSGGSGTFNNGMTTTINFGSNSPRLQTVLVFTHEMGHNFGMPHDTECQDWCSAESAACTDSGSCTNCVIPSVVGGNFVMFPFSVDGSQANNEVFSECSRWYAGRMISVMGGCFTDVGTGPICGNGIVQGNEACDCGSLDPVVCAQQDPCCNTDCTIKSGFECSDQAGDCCDNCMLIGADNFSSIPPEAVPCRPETECVEAIYCIKDLEFKGRCPDMDYPHHNLTFPEGCDIYDGSLDANCTRILPEHPSTPYLFHKTDGTLCNSGSKTCQYNGCFGDVCELWAHNITGTPYTPTECFPTESPNDCVLRCQFFDNGDCIDTTTFAATANGSLLNVTTAYRSPGRSCQSYSGYCSSTGACLGASSDSPLDILASLDVISFFNDNWLYCAIAEVLIVGAAFLLRATYRRRSEIRHALNHLGETTRKTLRRRPQKHADHLRGVPHKRAGTVARSKIPITQKVERRLARAKALHEREVLEKRRQGFRRVRRMFPTASEHVLRGVMAASPHEEALVFRMLLLGYPLDTSITTLRTLTPQKTQPSGARANLPQSKPLQQQRHHQPQQAPRQRQQSPRQQQQQQPQNSAQPVSRQAPGRRK